jgi:hypothetical protein
MLLTESREAAPVYLKAETLPNGSDSPAFPHPPRTHDSAAPRILVRRQQGGVNG